MFSRPNGQNASHSIKPGRNSPAAKQNVVAEHQPGHDPQPWTDCARKVFPEKRAFYVRYDVNSSDRGGEFESAFGIASDGSGLVYQVEH
jgi:hypothetical protein